ncbi:MAG TPA: type II toxin-antitoxin system VapC family toxin [Thermodesulfovibrionia bacterium]|nr:type II toxin-antitoxin system VapC family toxin [Thermodesulfovibrionia bacterium]
MSFFLDTHAFMWFVNGDPILGNEAKKIIESIDNQNFISVASLWEIAIKINIGKLSLSKPYNYIKQQLEDNHVAILPIDFNHTLQLVSLPLYHRDPFDRLIIAQAIVENMTIITKDDNFKNYPIKIIW